MTTSTLPGEHIPAPCGVPGQVGDASRPSGDQLASRRFSSPAQEGPRLFLALRRESAKQGLLADRVDVSWTQLTRVKGRDDGLCGVLSPQQDVEDLRAESWAVAAPA